MTASGSAPADTASEEIGEALAAHRLTTPRQCLCGERQDGEWSDLWHAEHVAPFVARLVVEAEQRGRREGAAEALEGVLDDIERRAHVGGERDGWTADGWAAVAGIAVDVLNRKAELGSE